MSDLGSHAMRGAKWAVGARLLRTFIGLGTISVLSRFLTPVEFGLVALIGFVTGIVQVFGDFGTRVALVQRKDITRLEEDSVFWWSVASSAALVAVLMAAAEPIAALLGSPEAAGPLRWVSPILLMTALQGVPQTMIERRFAFDRIAIAELTAAVVGAATAVGLVLAGFKIEALVVPSLVSALVSGSMIIGFSGWWPRLQFSRAAVTSLLSYGGYVTASGLVTTVLSRLDRPIIGNRLSAGDLGYLAMAENIISAPIRITVQMVRRVMFPVMASIQDDDARLRRGYITTQHGLLMVMAPMALGLWALAEPVVELMLGPGWETVAVLLGYLTVRAAFNSVGDINGLMIAAKGWGRFQFYSSLVSMSLFIGVLLLTVDHGLVAIVAGRLALAFVMTFINCYFVLRMIKQSPWELLDVLSRPIVSAIVMTAAIVGLQPYLPDNSVVQLAAGIPLGIVVYAIMEFLIDRRRMMPLLTQVLRSRR